MCARIRAAGPVFKTLQTINRFIVRPVTPDELAESLDEKQELPPVRLKTQSYSLRLESGLPVNTGRRRTPYFYSSA